MDRARAAGLTGKAVWKNYPAAMLKSRTITEVARDAAREALNGVSYTPEELNAEVTIDDAGEQVYVVTTVAPPAAPAVPGGMGPPAMGVALVLEACGGDVAAAGAAWTAAGLPARGEQWVSMEAVTALVESLKATADDGIEGRGHRGTGRHGRCCGGHSRRGSHRCAGWPAR